MSIVTVAAWCIVVYFGAVAVAIVVANVWGLLAGLPRLPRTWARQKREKGAKE